MIGKRLRKIIPQMLSKINSNCEKWIILLMILNKEKEGWHDLRVKKNIYFSKRHKIKTSWWFLLFELSSILEQKLNFDLIKSM